MTPMKAVLEISSYWFSVVLSVWVSVSTHHVFDLSVDIEAWYGAALLFSYCIFIVFIGVLAGFRTDEMCKLYEEEKNES